MEPETAFMHVLLKIHASAAFMSMFRQHAKQHGITTVTVDAVIRQPMVMMGNDDLLLTTANCECGHRFVVKEPINV